MNDVNKQAVPLFTLYAREEMITTRNFGTVTVRELPVKVFEDIAIKHRGDADNNALVREVMCAAVEGPNGERFTPELLDELPARALFDIAELLAAAVRNNNMRNDDPEKA